MAKLKYLLAIIGAGLFGGCSKDVVSNHRNGGRDLGALVDAESDFRSNTDARGSSKSDGSKNGVKDSGSDFVSSRDLSHDSSDLIDGVTDGPRDAGVLPDRIPDGATADSGSRLDSYSYDMLPSDASSSDALVRDIGVDRRIGRDDLGSPDLGIDARVDASVRPVPYQCDPTTLALWHFDEPSPFNDDCGENHLVNHGSFDSMGQSDFGQARGLLGNEDYLESPVDARMNFGADSDFTIEAWFRIFEEADETDTIVGMLENRAPTSGYGLIFSRGMGFSGAGWGCILYENSMSSFVWSGDSFAGEGIDYSLADGRWHHAACVRSMSGTRLEAYIDGVLRGSRDITPRNPDNPAALTIGNTINGIAGGTQDFDGEVDEVRISNVARYGGS